MISIIYNLLFMITITHSLTNKVYAGNQDIQRIYFVILQPKTTLDNNTFVKYSTTGYMVAYGNTMLYFKYIFYRSYVQ